MLRLLPVVLALCSPLVRAQALDPLTITPIAPQTFRLDWLEGSTLSRILEGSPNLLTWESMGNPEIGLVNGRSLVFTSSEPRYFFRLREGAIRAGFNAEALAANDDLSSGSRELPFVVNFLGTEYHSCFVNNNGNITFGDSLSIFTPANLWTLNAQILAPFWADVDTRSEGTGLTRFSKSPGSTGYQDELVDGHRAFGVTYNDVGYFNLRPEKLNSFQVVLIEREDLAAGDFDVEFNYNKIQWETGDVDGENGYGGVPARVGISGRGPGPSAERFAVEVEGSGTSGSFLDKIMPGGIPNSPSGLIYRTWNTDVPGRLVFRFRSGVLQESINVYAGTDIALPRTVPKSVTLDGQVSLMGNTTCSILWTQVSGSPATISDPACLTPVMTLPAPGSYTFRLTGVTDTVPQFSSFDEVTVNVEDELLTVNAGNPLTSLATDPLTISLSGQASFTGGDPIVVSWIQSEGSPAIIESPSTLNTPVTLPGPGTYLFYLAATTSHEGRIYSEASEVLVTRQEDVLTVQAGSAIHLDAAAPFTVILAGQAGFTGGGALTLVWTQTAGETAVISDPAVPNPEVTLPGPGTYEFTLTATTSTTPPRSASSTVSVVHDAP